MSFFICGRLRFMSNRTWEQHQVLGFQIAEAALIENLFVLLGLNVGAASTAKDILEIPVGRLREDQLSFVITDSPVDPTADGLISPFENDEEEIRANMTRMRRFFETLWQITDIDRIEVYLSEGNDDIYDEQNIKLSGFEEVATERILKSFGPTAIQIPSPKLVLHKWSRDNRN